jgi:hypothetical protein
MAYEISRKKVRLYYRNEDEVSKAVSESDGV